MPLTKASLTSTEAAVPIVEVTLSPRVKMVRVVKASIRLCGWTLRNRKKKEEEFYCHSDNKIEMNFCFKIFHHQFHCYHAFINKKYDYLWFY